MANMGGSRLILIDPQCDINSKAKQAAAGAQASLEGALIYPNWNEFYAQEGTGLRLALTRRSGKLRPPLDLREALQQSTTQPRTKPFSDIYLIFGPEDNGLAASDMAFVNHSVQLPVYGDFKSLNLAQAVLLALYICQSELEGRSIEPPVDHPLPRPLYFPDETIRQWLRAMGFDIQARRSSAYLTLKRLLLQNQPTEAELQVLEAILQQNIRKLKSK